MYRQGDVLFVPAAEVPADAAPAGHTVVAHGEVSGHTHRFECGAEQWIAAGVQFVRVTGATAELVHEEHATLSLPGPGVYRVVHQREYDPPPEFREWVDPVPVRRTAD